MHNILCVCTYLCLNNHTILWLQWLLTNYFICITYNWLFIKLCLICRKKKNITFLFVLANFLYKATMETKVALWFFSQVNNYVPVCISLHPVVHIPCYLDLCSTVPCLSLCIIITIFCSQKRSFFHSWLCGCQGITLRVCRNPSSVE